jgi:oligoribonuclease
LVSQPREVVEDRMQKNSWWQQYPENRDTFIANLDKAKASEEVERDMVALIAEQFGNEPAVLAGTSIHNDRNFIRYWWPEFDAKLHYRMLDVSSFKIVMQGKYNDIFQKQEVHRALDDIEASIDELRYYLKHVSY